MSSLYRVFVDGYGLLHVSSHALETLVWTVRLPGARGFTGEKESLHEGLEPWNLFCFDVWINNFISFLGGEGAGLEPLTLLPDS